MQSITRLSIAAAAVAILAGCASTANPGPSGRHLVYRDASGQVVRQFDYPDDSYCRRVEAMAGSSARCQAAGAGGMQARATLRYSPPGILVEGHYVDMNRCRADTSVMSPGVELVSGCH